MFQEGYEMQDDVPKAIMSASRIMFALSDTLICPIPIDQIDYSQVSFPDATHVQTHE